MHFWPVMPNVDILELPLTLSTEPLSDDEDVETLIFKASLYSPLGTYLSSRSLFIRPDVKFLLNSGIFY